MIAIESNELEMDWLIFLGDFYLAIKTQDDNESFNLQTAFKIH